MIIKMVTRKIISTITVKAIVNLDITFVFHALLIIEKEFKGKKDFSLVVLIFESLL